jgi:hypothetical protein
MKTKRKRFYVAVHPDSLGLVIRDRCRQKNIVISVGDPLNDNEDNRDSISLDLANWMAYLFNNNNHSSYSLDKE